jgi:hypothetical protein
MTLDEAVSAAEAIVNERLASSATPRA